MLDAMYQEIILDHYKNPHHKGLRDPYDVEVHHINPSCGDEVTVRVKLKPATESDFVGSADAGFVVADVSYEGVGCSISQASESVMTDLVIGRGLPEALELQEQFLGLMQSRGDADKAESLEDVLEDAVAFVGVAKYPARVKCALLGWMAFKDAAAQAVAQGGVKT